MRVHSCVGVPRMSYHSHEGPHGNREIKIYLLEGNLLLTVCSHNVIRKKRYLVIRRKKNCQYASLELE